MNPNRTHARLALVALPLAAAVALTGCSKAGGQAGGDHATVTAGKVAIDASKCPADATKALAKGADIVIGTTTAMSGQAASAAVVLKGVQAYFDKVNDAGGVDGHKIKFMPLDDAFDPARAVTNVQQLISQDHVLAVLGQLGTAQATGSQALYESSCTPQLYTSSGAPNFYDPAQHPWSTSGFVPYASWGQAVAQYLQKQFPTGAKVGELLWNSDTGKASDVAFQAAIKGTNVSVVALQTHDSSAVSLTNQATALLAKHPDAIVAATGGSFCPQIVTAARRAGYSGPIIMPFSCRDTQFFFVPLGSLATNVLSLEAEVDPGDTAQSNNPDVQTYLADMAKYAPDAPAKSVYIAAGYHSAAMLVEQLKRAAQMKDGLTRVDLMNAVWTTDAAEPLNLPGQRTVINGDHPYPEGTGALWKYDAATKSWQDTGVLVQAGQK